MISISTHRQGTLDKRMQSTPFRSVLSLDIEYRGAMPNLKISNRNTIQATGCQDMQLLGEILAFLVCSYQDRGFDLPPAAGLRRQPVTFVGDIVLANIHYKLGWRVDRLRLRDVMNEVCRDFVASYEPLVRDVLGADGHTAAPSSLCQCEHQALRGCTPAQRWCSVSHVDPDRQWRRAVDYGPIPGRHAHGPPCHHQTVSALSHLSRVCHRLRGTGRVRATHARTLLLPSRSLAPEHVCRIQQFSSVHGTGPSPGDTPGLHNHAPCTPGTLQSATEHTGGVLAQS